MLITVFPATRYLLGDSAVKLTLVTFTRNISEKKIGLNFFHQVLTLSGPRLPSGERVRYKTTYDNDKKKIR